ncbi:hypothetical protein SAMN04487869_1405 [Marinobacter sp. DSM 26671]|nr:hypothetical protein SAMN04487869_1405 [Marinobacter sp. DSM 26671]
MRKIREVLRLRLEAGLSIRQISASTKTSFGAIQKLLARADALNLNWPLPEDLDDGRLAALFYPGADRTTSTRYQVPDWATVHQELKRKGMTKQLLWEEFTAEYTNHCYSYSQETVTAALLQEYKCTLAYQASNWKAPEESCASIRPYFPGPECIPDRENRGQGRYSPVVLNYATSGEVVEVVVSVIEYG